MKLRLLEYISCPDHPDEFMQLRDAHVARLFDHAVEVSSPLCRHYCGLAQGKFTDLPEDFILDCQSCIAMELQRGYLSCPVCSGFYALYEGIPILSTFFPGGTPLSYERFSAEFNFGDARIAEYRRRGAFMRFAERRENAFLASKLNLDTVDSVLYLGSASSSVIDMLCELGIEVFIAEPEPHQLMRIHERELLNPSRLAFFLVSDSLLEGIRPESFDLILSGVRLYGPPGYEPPPSGEYSRICKRSGSIAMFYYHDQWLKRLLKLCEGDCGAMKETAYTTEKYEEKLPDGLTGMDRTVHKSFLGDLVIYKFPDFEAEEIRSVFHGDEAEAMINA